MTTEIKQETNKTPIEIEDKTHRLEEMSDAMKQSIQNAQKVREEQLALIKLVETSEQHEQFADFCKTLKAQCDDLDGQIATLLLRVATLDEVTSACRENEANAKLCSMLMKALGVFEK